MIVFIRRCHRKQVGIKSLSAISLAFAARHPGISYLDQRRIKDLQASKQLPVKPVSSPCTENSGALLVGVSHCSRYVLGSCYLALAPPTNPSKGVSGNDLGGAANQQAIAYLSYCWARSSSLSVAATNNVLVISSCVSFLLSNIHSKLPHSPPNRIREPCLFNNRRHGCPKQHA